MATHIKLGNTPDIIALAHQLRQAVFVVEQGVPLALEYDDMDAVSQHAVLVDDSEQALATGRLLPDGTIGRMAVHAQARGQGLGAQVLQALMKQAQQQGLSQVQLSAQVHALPFYERYGFVAEGAIYEEAGIAHQYMRCQLPVV